MCAARARGLWDEQAKDRKVKVGKGRPKQVKDSVPEAIKMQSRDAVGAVSGARCSEFGVRGRTVDRASQIMREGVLNWSRQ